MESSTGKRKGKHGSFKKNTQYIENDKDRERKEKAKLESLQKLIEETAKLTKMPIALFALKSNAKLVLAGSTNGAQSFVNDEDVRAKFLSCVVGDTEPSSKRMKQPDEESDEASIKSHQTLNLSSDWRSKNTIEKRKLVRHVVCWFFGFEDKQFKWAKEEKPQWWPEDIEFESPKLANTAKVDKILNSFVEFQIKGSMGSLTDALFPDCLDWNDLMEWSVGILSSNEDILEWMRNDWRKPDVVFDKEIVSLKNRNFIGAETGCEPVSFESVAECLSFSVFSTRAYHMGMKAISVASCVGHFDKLVNSSSDECVSMGIGVVTFDFTHYLNFGKIAELVNHKYNYLQPELQVFYQLKDGINGIEPDQIKKLLAASDEESLKDAILNSYRSSSLIEVFGIAVQMKVSFAIHTEDKQLFEIDFGNGDSSQVISLLFMESAEECCSLVEVTNFSASCCGENPYCHTVLSEAQQTLCGDCNLVYHTFCCGGSIEACGCSELKFLESRIKELVLDTENYKKVIRKFYPKLTIERIIKGIQPTYRAQTVQRIVNSKEARLETNFFFQKVMACETRELTIKMIEDSLSDSSRDAIFHRFPEKNFDSVVSEWLLPDAIIHMLKWSCSGGVEYNNMTIERAFRNLSKELKYRSIFS